MRNQLIPATKEDIDNELKSTGEIAEALTKRISAYIEMNQNALARDLINHFNYLFYPFYIGINGKIYRG